MCIYQLFCITILYDASYYLSVYAAKAWPRVWVNCTLQVPSWAGDLSFDFLPVFMQEGDERISPGVEYVVVFIYVWWLFIAFQVRDEVDSGCVWPYWESSS